MLAWFVGIVETPTSCKLDSDWTEIRTGKQTMNWTEVLNLNIRIKAGIDLMIDLVKMQLPKSEMIFYNRSCQDLDLFFDVGVVCWSHWNTTVTDLIHQQKIKLGFELCNKGVNPKSHRSDWCDESGAGVLTRLGDGFKRAAQSLIVISLEESVDKYSHP